MSMSAETARDEAFARYNGDLDAETGAPVDDWGYSEAQRQAFVAGAEWSSLRYAEARLERAFRRLLDGTP